MEDTHAVLQWKDLFLAGVFDGHCGKEVAQLAADQLLSLFVTAQIGCPDIAKAWQHAFVEIDKIANLFPVVGACACAASISEDGLLTVANAGDCEAAVFGDINRYGYTKIGSVHSVGNNREDTRRALRDGAASITRGRLWLPEVGALAVTRSLGDWHMKAAGIIPTPEVYSHQISPESKYLILGSDGLFDAVSCGELAPLLHRGGSLEGFEEELTLQLSHTVVRDNATAVVIDLQS